MVQKHLMGLSKVALSTVVISSSGGSDALSSFPEPLRTTMVEHYLGKIAPLWYRQQALQVRDARMWIQQQLVQIAFSMLGVLAGENRVYLSPFQMKRTRRFVAQLRAAPANLADRLDALFDADAAEAIEQAERLVAETLDRAHRAVESDLHVLRYQPGERQVPRVTRTPDAVPPSTVSRRVPRCAR